MLGASPWQTPYQLWATKTGRLVQEVTDAMRHGTVMEPAARSAYEAATEQVMQPLVLVEGLYSASLDGIDLDGELIVEIKCPYKGGKSPLWQAVQRNEVPEHYLVQIQHQLMVSGASVAHLWVFDGSNGILVTVLPDQEMFQCIKCGWDNFQQYLDEDRPPPLSDSDVLIRTDDIWRVAAQAYARLKTESDDLAVQVENARQRLIQLASHNSERGFGVMVSRYMKAGSVDYKKVPQLQDVDLELYRGKTREEVRVTVQ